MEFGTGEGSGLGFDGCGVCDGAMGSCHCDGGADNGGKNRGDCGLLHGGRVDVHHDDGIHRARRRKAVSSAGPIPKKIWVIIYKLTYVISECASCEACPPPSSCIVGLLFENERKDPR